MTWGEVVVGLVVAATPVVLLACGAPQRSQQPPAGAMVLPVPPPPDKNLSPLPDAHAEIDELDWQIRRDREQLGVAAPDPIAVDAAHAMAASELVPTCVRSTTTTCADVCTLADAICANADRICTLAAELPGDAWAEQRCDAGKATCQAAGDRCCSCATL